MLEKFHSLKKISFKYSLLFALLAMLAACSVKKNTSGTRAYHNLTSRYNILFNGTESYKKGMINLQNSYKDDYAEILPVFIYSNKEQLTSISSEMDRSISKATKLISMHSITTKPKLEEDKGLTDKEREFYNKSEYNRWVDDAYLLMGKAHFHKQEFDKASETFQYIISNFPEDENAFEAKIWMARLAIEKNKLKEADENLSALEKEPTLSKKNKFDLAATYACLALKRDDLEKTIIYLKNSLEFSPEKYYKQRYNFILAQLYQKTKQPALATKYYLKTIKLDPPYEMTFNAQINMALAYESGIGSRKEIEKQLQKMLRDDKNIEFQDQIYYAWGNLYLKSGDKTKAIEYYKLSATLGKNNTKQLARTFLTIADLYYEIPDYIPAQAYYDSAVGVIDVSYPNYSMIYAKSISLTNLVGHIQTVQLEDSVQALAKMPRPQLMAYIDKIIEQVRKAEEEAKLQEQELQLQESFVAQQTFELQNTKNSSFYYYNPTAVNLGRQDFKRKWGPRKLEDNWRRKNKSSVAFEQGLAENAEPEEESEEGVVKKAGITNKYSQEYYLQNIPFTDSALAASHERIKTSLFETGNIYFNELKDYEKASDAYLKLINRYPKNEFELQAYYKLYSIGKIQQNIDMVALYQQKILNEYPNSNFAKVLGDPDYFKKIEQEEKQFQLLYAEIYNLFDQRQYTRVAELSRKAISDFPEHELVPQFNYMITVSEGVSKDTAIFISDLQKLISKYPNTEISGTASLLVAYLQKASPEAAKEQKVAEAKAMYTLDLQAEHYVALVIPKTANSNQLMFNITNFNIDNYSDNDLKVIKAEIEQKWAMMVIPFADAATAAEYLNKVRNDSEIWRDVNQLGSSLFIISKQNFELLKKENKLETYQLFFETNYK